MLHQLFSKLMFSVLSKVFQWFCLLWLFKQWLWDQLFHSQHSYCIQNIHTAFTTVILCTTFKLHSQLSYYTQHSYRIHNIQTALTASILHLQLSYCIHNMHTAFITRILHSQLSCCIHKIHTVFTTFILHSQLLYFAQHSYCKRKCPYFHD